MTTINLLCLHFLFFFRSLNLLKLVFYYESIFFSLSFLLNFKTTPITTLLCRGGLCNLMYLMFLHLLLKIWNLHLKVTIIELITRRKLRKCEGIIARNYLSHWFFLIIIVHLLIKLKKYLFIYLIIFYKNLCDSLVIFYFF